MDGRIGRLNLRCKILGASQNAGALQARLERVARQQLAAEYEAAIGSALGDDPSVYVLRKVNARPGCGPHLGPARRPGGCAYHRSPTARGRAGAF